MSSFRDFLATFDTEPTKRGRQFEHFVKWFLKNDPEWTTQVDKIWLWEEYPGRWGRDCGIDLVFRHKSGEIWAVQAKCYSYEYDITKKDVDKFLSESNREGIDKRLLIATTNGFGANAKQVCDAQEKKVVRFFLSHFEDADVIYPTSFNDLPKARPKDKPKPREHQLKAVKDIISGFKTMERGQLIMACGTGKTFTTLWIKEGLEARNTLILVPSLSLLSQTLHEWTLAANDPFEVLCVCSDESIGKKDLDEFVNSVEELAFPVTSSAVEIENFLSRDVKKVVFSTYQSSQLIAEAQNNKNIPSFDLTIADEAHRCAGNIDGVFSSILDSNKIRSSKRLFATATPKTYKKSVKKSAEERGIQISGMDDENIFGKVFYRLNFSKAIQLGLLTDYQVVVIGVDSSMISNAIKRRQLVSLEGKFATDAKSLSGYIGLLKAIKDFNLCKTITFHSRVKMAKEFAANLLQISKLVAAETLPHGDLKSDYISGDMASSLRRRKLFALRLMEDGQRGVLSNARCLSEGVDLPSLDSVVFIDPKQSQIDIIQAVGRAIRLSESKKLGTIVLPVFIDNGVDADIAISGSEFKPVWDVLNALKSQDDQLCTELDNLRFELGKSDPPKGPILPPKIILDLPSNVSSDFEQNLRTYLVESTTESWDFMYGLLVAYTLNNGTSRVPNCYKTHHGYNLGNWVQSQRASRKHISDLRNQKLEALDHWTWNPYEDLWSIGFSELKKFSDQNGSCIVPPSYKSAVKNLNNWVKTQRNSKEQLSEERKAKLEGLIGWVWNVTDHQWDQGIFHLSNYVKKYGSALVPIKYIDMDTGYKLGNWVGAKRSIKSELSLAQVELLEAFPGWTWDVPDSRWEDGFNYLLKYIEAHGSKRLTNKYVTPDGFKLWSWVVAQRKLRDSLSEEKIRKLESTPNWTWDPLGELWTDGYEKLIDYVSKHGNASPPISFVSDDGFTLGLWVSRQRRNKNQLTPDRLKKIESIDGWIWDPNEKAWDDQYEELFRYASVEGHCLVPTSYKTLNGKSLFHFVNDQRKHKRKGSLSQDRENRLNKIPNWTWDPAEQKWQKDIYALLEYIKQNGTCDVPVSFVTDSGFRLGQWAASRRTDRELLSEEKRRLLESLPGWSWNKVEEKWGSSYKILKKQITDFPDVKITATFKTKDGYNLGAWVVRQRKNKSFLSLKQIQKLEALESWYWDGEGETQAQCVLNLNDKG